MMNETPFRAPSCRTRRGTGWLAGPLLLFFGASPAGAQPQAVTPPAVAPAMGGGAAAPPQRAELCPASEEAPDAFREALESDLASGNYQGAIDKIAAEREKRYCPIWDCYFAIYYSLLSQKLQNASGSIRRDKWQTTLVYANHCIDKGAIDPGGGAYRLAGEIRGIKANAESYVTPQAQPAYQRDVKLSVGLGITGLAMLLGGAISFAVLERQPVMLNMSACMPSSGFRDEACGTRLYGLTGSLMAVGSAAVGGAVGLGVRLLFFPKSYLPKDPPTPEDAAARGGAR